MRVNDSDTFVKNRGYHHEKGTEVSLLGPRTDDESGRRMTFSHRSTAASHAQSTTANDGILHRAELAPATSAFPGPVALVRAH